MYVCMYVCVCVRVCACVRVRECMYTCIHVSIEIKKYICKKEVSKLAG